MPPVRIGDDTKPSFRSGEAVDKNDFYKQLELAQKGLLEDVNKAREVEEEASDEMLFEPEEEKAAVKQDLTTDDDDDYEEEVQPQKQNNARGRINKEIEKRKALEEQLASEREQRQKDREQLIREQTQRELMESALSRLNAPRNEPAADVDPLDVDSHNLYMGEINKVKAEIDQYRKEREAHDREIHMSNTIARQVAEYTSEKPDYTEAYQFLVQKEESRLAAMGASPQEIGEILSNQYKVVAQNALAKGQRVPELVYKLAETMGYSGKTSTKPNNIQALARNRQNSADLTKEVPAVASSLRANSYDPATMNWEDVNEKVWEDGRFNPDAFKKMLSTAEKKSRTR